MLCLLLPLFQAKGSSQNMCISIVAAMVMMTTHHGRQVSYSTSTRKTQSAQVPKKNDAVSGMTQGQL